MGTDFLDEIFGWRAVCRDWVARCSGGVESPKQHNSVDQGSVRSPFGRELECFSYEIWIDIKVATREVKHGDRDSKFRRK